MIEFNADGSIRLPSNILDEKRKQEYRMTSTRCAKIRKETVSIYAPKQCMIHLIISNALKDTKQIEEAISRIKMNCETPMKIIKGIDNEFKIEIGTNFKRCSDCNKIIDVVREMLDGNVLLDKGSCTLKEREFCFEDHFD